MRRRQTHHEDPATHPSLPCAGEPTDAKTARQLLATHDLRDLNLEELQGQSQTQGQTQGQTQDPVLTEAIEEFLYSLTDYCPPFASLIQDHMYGWLATYRPNGALRCLYQTKCGVPHGLYLHWHPNGKLKYLVHYVEGQKEGVQKMWRETTLRYLRGHVHSDLEYACHFVNGRKHGLFQRWHENGVLASEYTYDAGKRHGLCRSWDNRGGPLVEAHYDHGQLHGVYKDYCFQTDIAPSANRPRYKVTYVEGKKHGTAYYFGLDRRIARTCEYDHGKETSATSYGDYNSWLYIDLL
jgi:antitoxin component YwqK of YwqJK toxin-antitoxin module